MAISEAEVRRIAALARVGVDEARLPELAAQLGSILEHMDALQRVDVDAGRGTGAPSAGMPLRDDVGPSQPLARSRDSFAPQMYDGFFLVPRLATHETVDE